MDWPEVGKFPMPFDTVRSDNLLLYLIVYLIV